MSRLHYITIPTLEKIEQIPIVLEDDWIISDVDSTKGYILLKNTLNGNIYHIRIPNFTDNNRMDFSKKMSDLLINGITKLVDSEYDDVMVKPTTKTQSLTRNMKVEKPFYLPKELFEAVDFSEMGIINEPKDHIPKFIKGEKYSLKGVSCEGFEMPEKVYELIGEHDEYDGITINSVIVKQISGLKDKIFTLSKNDCACMGIEYEEGLQLFPKHLNWKRVKDIIPFDKSNLGTTPTSDIDNTVRYIVLKLNGFKDYVDGYILTPSGKIIKEAQFADTFKIVSNEPIVYEKPSGTMADGKQGLRMNENTPLEAELVYPKGLTFNHGNFISSEDSIYILVKLAVQTRNAISIDGLSGVQSANFDGFNPNDHFIISWDEIGAYTVEEYEAEKARKERLRQERAAKEELERQKRIEAEEKRIREQRKRTEAAVERMKNYKIDIPSFPKMPNFSMENGLSSLNLYMDSLDLYFNSLDSTLAKVGRDLTNLTSTIGLENTRRNNGGKSLIDMLKL